MPADARTTLKTLEKPDDDEEPRGLWRRFWSRAPRQLRFTRDGKVVIGLALIVGFAAINTGNNLLFLGWSLLLSAIVLSGLLSEATLRPLLLTAAPPQRARAQEPTAILIDLVNAARRVPAFAVETGGRVQGPDGRHNATAPYQLRLEPRAAVRIGARFTPQRRGLHRVLRLTARTSYPFGFFEKSRRFLSPEPVDFWVMPYAVDVGQLAVLLLSRLGEEAAREAGSGDDFFSLRPYREGDDLRRVHWRRSARTGRWVIKETEATRGSRVILELHLGRAGSVERTEHAIAVLGSLTEALAARGLCVGAHGPGLAVLPAAGLRQAQAVLAGLARMEASDVWPQLHAPGVYRVALVARGAAAPAQADAVVEVPDPPEEPA